MNIEIAIWIYWVFCAIATLLVVTDRKFVYELLGPKLKSSCQDREYTFSLLLGWGMTLLAAIIYILFTVKHEAGSYKIPDLILFSLLNGALEQFMFIFWFLGGCYLAQERFPKQSIIVFVMGYISYCLYSGAIHPLFWFQVLPEHEPFALMALVLPCMSTFWMWLLWRYRAVMTIIVMHIAIDFLTVGHLHFTWFEPLQKLIHS